MSTCKVSNENSTAPVFITGFRRHAAFAVTNVLESLTLEQALEMAERLQPQLAEARALVEAAAGRAQQAGTL